MSITDRAVERIKKFEGFRKTPYKDSKGIYTCFFGRNLEDVGLSAEEIVVLLRDYVKFTSPAVQYGELLLSNDLGKVERELEEEFAFYPVLPDNVRIVYLDMCYNLGINRLLRFNRFHDAATQGDWDKAAMEILWSKYLFDVKRRAVENAQLVCHDWRKTLRLLSDASNPHYRKVLEIQND